MRVKSFRSESLAKISVADVNTFAVGGDVAKEEWQTGAEGFNDGNREAFSVRVGNVDV